MSTKFCLSDNNEAALHGDLSSVPDLEEVHEKLPANASIEVEVKKSKGSVTCELRCSSEWGKFVARCTDSTVQKALGEACRSVLRSIDIFRHSELEPAI